MTFVPVKDITSLVGDSNYYIVGDIHGCLDELLKALDSVGFNVFKDHLISVGDLVDRGPKTREVLEFVMNLPHFHSVQGNHDNRLYRYLKGNNVKMGHGLTETLKQIDGMDKAKLFEFFDKMPYIIKVQNNYIVHAGFNPTRPPDKQTREDCLYIRFFGGKDYFDNQNGKFWYQSLPVDYPNVFFGHEVHLGTCGVQPNAFAMDGGCVFGGDLRIAGTRLIDRSSCVWVTKVKAAKIYSGEPLLTEEAKQDKLNRSRESFNENEVKT